MKMVKCKVATFFRCSDDDIVEIRKALKPFKVKVFNIDTGGNYGTLVFCERSATKADAKKAEAQH